MIKKITLLAFLLIGTVSFAQPGMVGHLTIFSEDGDKFTLILNGEVINDVPQTNLRVEDLNQPYYNAKIKFEDNTLADITKNNLMLTDVDGIFAAGHSALQQGKPCLHEKDEGGCQHQPDGIQTGDDIGQCGCRFSSDGGGWQQ